MLDLLPALGGILLDEILVDRKADQVDAVAKGMALELLQVAAMLGCQWLLFRDVHLAVEDIDAADAKLGGFVDDRFDGHLRIAKVPIGVAAQPKLDAFFADRMGGWMFLALSAEGRGRSQAGRRGEKRTSIHHVLVLSTG